MEFDRYWSTYLLTKVGCPVGPGGVVVRPLEARDCTLPATVDAGSYYRARELAKKVFKLRDNGQ